MAMTKKEKAAIQAAIDRAETLASLRWTWPVVRDVGVPLQGYSEGWDYNAHSQRLVAVFDDRDRVVAMWSAAGVPCFQVAAGEF